MNFKLADIITDANKDIATSLYIDPLGMLVIWSSYGEAIFEERVNSISNDAQKHPVLAGALLRSKLMSSMLVLQR